MTAVKIVVEKHSDGYVAYPIGLNGACVAQGDTFEQVMAEIKSAVRFHLDTFGKDALLQDADSPIMEAFIAEASLAVS